MNKQKLFKGALSLLLCAAPFGKSFATTVNDSQGLVDAVQAATDGETILLETANYTTKFNVPGNKVVTLKAAEGATPVLKFTAEINSDGENGGLVFDGLNIENSVNYIFSLGNHNIREITFRNCHIKAMKRGLYSIGSKKILSKFTIDNCIIDAVTATSYSFIYNNGGTTQEVVMTNSTFYNYPNEHLYWARSYGQSLDFSFTFTNNTVYKWSKGNYRLCRIEENGFNGTYVFTDNIIAEPYVAGASVRVAEVAGTGTLTARNNLVINFGGDNKYTGNSLTMDVQDLDASQYELSFPQADEGIFSVYSNSPLATASTTGGLIGAPRWLVQASTFWQLTTGCLLGNEATTEAGSVNIASTEVADGSELTIVATENFGFHFVKWVDETGAELSTEKSYTFTVSADMTVKAVFEAVEVYTLNVNIEGAQGYGNVTISPAGKDGKYEQYEAGTVVTLTASSNKAIAFSHWDEGITSTEYNVTMDQNRTVTATFAENEYIAGWDFSNRSKTGPYAADYLSNRESAATLHVYKADGSDSRGKIGDRYDKTGVQVNISVADAPNRDSYFQAEFSTVGYNNVRVSSYLLAYYFSWLTQKVQYAIGDGEFQDIQSFDINDRSWTACDVTLPAEANGKEVVKVRWYPDMNGANTNNTTAGNELMIAEVFILADKEIISDNEAPVLVSSVPANNATGASASGQIVLTFDEKVQAGTAKATLNGEEVTPNITNRTVTYAYAGLQYSTEYEFVLQPGAIVDMSDNAFEGTTIRFTTMDRPVPALKAFDFIVDPEATPVAGKVGNTIESAFAAAPSNSSTRFFIYVKNGEYEEIVTLPKDKNKVSLIGQSRDGVIIKGLQNGIKSPVVNIAGADFYAENLTIQNTQGMNDGVGVAITTEGERGVYKNVRMLAFQDTQVTGGSQYLENCEIHGTVDFICGGGDCFYESCLLYLENRSGNVIVAGSQSQSELYGYVFNNCTIDGTENNDGQYSLGRPWQNYPRAVFLNTVMKVEPQTKGWTNMGALAPALYAEYNSVREDGSIINLSNRTNVFTRGDETFVGDYNPVLTAEEAQNYTLNKVFGEWQPALATEAVAAPAAAQTQEYTLAWEAVPYATGYVIVRDGKMIASTTDTHFNDADALENGTYTYTVYAVNEFGGLSEASEPVVISIGSSVELNDMDLIRVFAQNGTVYVKNLPAGSHVIASYSFGGALVNEVATTAPEVSFDMPAGNYIIKVVAGEGVAVRKVQIR